MCCIKPKNRHVHAQQEMSSVQSAGTCKRRRRAVRTQRRQTASASTVAAVSSDLWLIVCLHAAHSPHTVFRLMMASKSVRAAFVENGAASDAWWRDFFGRVCAYQNGLKHSNFRKRLLAYERRGQMGHADILRSVFSPRCEHCGARYGHRLLRPFGLRVCATCLPQCVISNHALEQDYGLAFFELLEAYAHVGGPLLPLDAFYDRASALGRLLPPSLPASEWRFFAYEYYYHRAAMNGQHEHPRLRLSVPDAAAVPTTEHTRIRSGALVFLWRADVERALSHMMMSTRKVAPTTPIMMMMMRVCPVDAAAAADGDGCGESSSSGPHHHPPLHLLEGLAVIQGVRRRAAAMLSARVRRLGEQRLFERDFRCVPVSAAGLMMIIMAGHTAAAAAASRPTPPIMVMACSATPIMASILRAQSRAAARNSAPMLAPAPRWMPGGALNSASGRPRLMTLPQEARRLQRLEAMVATATRALIHVAASSSETWFPPPSYVRPPPSIA